jgi:hypothetical protein
MDLLLFRTLYRERGGRRGAERPAFFIALYLKPPPYPILAILLYTCYNSLTTVIHLLYEAKQCSESLVIM